MTFYAVLSPGLFGVDAGHVMVEGPDGQLVRSEGIPSCIGYQSLSDAENRARWERESGFGAYAKVWIADARSAEERGGSEAEDTKIVLTGVRFINIREA